MRQLRLAVLLLLSALLAAGNVSAQSLGTPLMVSVQGGQYNQSDDWAWTGKGLSQRTANHFSGLPMVSPKGDSFAYSRITPHFLANVDQNSDQIPPADIYVMTFRTDKTVMIAGQPATTSYVAGQMHYTIRSRPAWSPDGLKLIWTESNYDPVAAQNADPAVPQPDESLVIYDVLTGKITTLVAKLPPYRVTNGYPILSRAYPGADGYIAVEVSVNASVDSSMQDWLYFYDGAGDEIAHTAQLEKADSNYQYSDIIWLNNLSQPYVSCVACTTKIDPQTGVVSDLGGVPELYSALAPNALSLYYKQASSDEANVTWVIALHGKPVSSFDSVRISVLSDCAISPDGLQIAAASYAGQGTTGSLFIYQARTGHTIQFDTNLLGLSWGPMAWRVHPNPSL